ncbi:MAG TPA: type II toxin-antitoxin system VapC family toxin [Thermoanaerobaculia bacterium]|nr:type II toxin-antitoxin system VapC family toxin [Thermoanaerobaculia bacterium]
MPWLADTNVLSELVRPHPNAGVAQWATGIERISVSVITLEEIMFGLAWKPNAKIRKWFAQFFADACDVLPITEAIAERAGLMRGELRAEGQTRSQADMLIAATAQVHGLTLVTRNVRDFEGCRITVLNPFVAR